MEELTSRDQKGASQWGQIRSKTSIKALSSSTSSEGTVVILKSWHKTPVALHVGDLKLDEGKSFLEKVEKTRKCFLVFPDAEIVFPRYKRS